jgi:hypothetical protein
VTRVPGAQRGGLARHRQERAFRLLSSASARADCPVHASGTHRAKAGACSARLAGPPRGNAAEGPTQLASVGASEQRGESLTRVRGQTARSGVPARRHRLQKSANEARGSEKRDPAGKRARGRGPGSRRSPQGGTREFQGHRRPAPRWPSRGAGRGPSRAFERTSRGRGFRAMEGTLGRDLGFLVHAREHGAALAALEVIRERANGHGIAGEATGVSEARYARITTGRQRPSR